MAVCRCLGAPWGKIPASLNAETVSSGLADLFLAGFHTDAKVLLLTISQGDRPIIGEQTVCRMSLETQIGGDHMAAQRGMHSPGDSRGLPHSQGIGR